MDSSSQCIGFCSTKFLKIAFHFEGRGKKFTNIINNTILVKIIITSIIKIITRKILIYINVSILSSVYCYGRLLDCHPSTVLKGGGVPTVIRLHFWRGCRLSSFDCYGRLPTVICLMKWKGAPPPTVICLLYWKGADVICLQFWKGTNCYLSTDPWRSWTVIHLLLPKYIECDLSTDLWHLAVLV